MKDKQLPAITLSIDTKKYQELADKELDKQAREVISDRLNMLFVNPVTEQARHEYMKNRTNNNPDLSAGYNFIKDLIDKRLLSDEFQAYAERYIDNNWQRILDASLETALTHKANGIAFRVAKGKLELKPDLQNKLT